MAVPATMREAAEHDPPALATGAFGHGETARSTPSVQLLGYRIDQLDLEATAQTCCDAILRNERVHHVSLAAAKAVNARGDRRLAEILGEAELVTADGQSLVWASRLLGEPLPERVAGIDLMLRLLEIAEAEGFRVFFLGARADVLARASTNLRARYPRLIIAGSHHGYFDADRCDDVCAEINQARPNILFVAMSSPRKEYWVGDYGSRLDAQVIVGVGGSLDVLAGVVRRAPRWVQRSGLEWAFRLFQEPRRLWRRYLFTNGRFIAIVAAAFGRRALERRALPWRPL
jgi:N-acetylglucosaminyldiphosphoundecaprenol N-acetyl-beta-D-mannosaminyltransferase